VIRLSSARTGVVPSKGELDRSVLNASALNEPSGANPDLSALPDIPGIIFSGRLEEESMLDQLDRRDRLRLVEFVCSFAWADLEIQPEERVFISRLIRKLDLGEDEDLQVQKWLERPPQIDDLDPTSIPEAHRRVFLEAIEGLIGADGEVSEEERDSFEIFKQLLGD
jgi:hypothetical protein